MRLIDIVNASPRRLVVPLAGYPGAGCDLPAETPMENIITLVETVKAYKPR